MTHSDIYTKFMIEYDKANITSSYPSLTEYEIATILDKAYLALIALKLTGMNTRKAAFESDVKAVEDLRPLIKTLFLTKFNNASTVLASNEYSFKLPSDLLYYLSGLTSISNTYAAIDSNIHSNLNTKLLDHETAEKFKTTETNLPWISHPVTYIEGSDLHVLIDPYKYSNPSVLLFVSTYISKPAKFAFVGEGTTTDTGNNSDNTETSTTKYSVTIKQWNEDFGFAAFSAGLYSSGDVVELNATLQESDDFTFDHWEITSSSGNTFTTLDKIYKLVVDGDTTAVAIFYDTVVESQTTTDPDTNNTGKVDVITYEYKYPSTLNLGTLPYNTITAEFTIYVIRYTYTNGELTYTNNLYYSQTFPVSFLPNNTTSPVTRSDQVSYSVDGEIHYVTWKCTLDSKPEEQLAGPVKYYITVASESTTKGTVTTTNVGSVTSGTSYTITATANDGYTFNGWYANGIKKTSSLTYTTTATENTTWIAKFDEVVITHKVNIEESVTTIISGNTSGLYKDGTEITINCEVSRDSYVFTGWYICDESTDTTSMEYSKTLTLKVTSDLTIYPLTSLSNTSKGLCTVKFDEDYSNIASVYTIDTNPARSDGTTYIDAECIVTITPKDGYTINGITVKCNETSNVITKYTTDDDEIGRMCYSFLLDGTSTVKINYVKN